MSRNLGYRKKFIILKKDYLNIQDIDPKGHAKLEIRGAKGTFSLNIQNAEANEIYFCTLVQNDRSYILGKIYTDEYGKAKEDLEFNVQDVEVKGISVDRLNGLIITKEDKILLHGYMDKDDGSLKNYINNIEIRKPIEIEETKEEEVEKEEIEEIEKVEVEEKVEDPLEEETVGLEEVEEPVPEEEEIEEEVEPEEDTASEEDIPADAEDIEMDYSEYIDSDSYIGLSLESEPEVEAGEIEPEYIETEQTIPLDNTVYIEPAGKEEDSKVTNVEDNRRESQKQQTTNYILNILRFFPFVEPFKIPLKGYSWWKIDFQGETRGFLPYFSYVAGDQEYNSTEKLTSANTLMNLYGHYLFGLYNVNEEVRYYIYAVPGEFTKEEHPQDGNTGFNTYFEGNDGLGYWLLYIDPLTGKVMYPINPMNPID